jgi:hypothetical protein
LKPLTGYETYLRVADSSLNILRDVARGHPLTLTVAQLRAALTLVADAADLMSQPRIHEDVVLGNEGVVVCDLRMLLSHAERLLLLDQQGMASVIEAFGRLERSGVIQQRDMESMNEFVNVSIDAGVSATAAAAAAPGLRSCGLASCGAREAHLQHFKSCAACRIPVYCCKEHQTEDWPSHKAACKAARKATAERAG